jgi:hypothetical protein
LEAGEELARRCGVQATAALVIFFSQLAEGVGGCEREGGAGDLVSGFASKPSGDFFSYSTHEFSGETLDYLGPEADACDGEEFLDTGAVEFDSMGATDAVNHFHLQVDQTKPWRKGLWPQLQSLLKHSVVLKV